MNRLAFFFYAILDEDYNRNKYLINGELGIYTRYKFTNGKLPYSDQDPQGNTNLFLNYFNGDIVWVDNKSTNKHEYYLFKNGETPNSGKTTFLTESLVVTLGGGKDVQSSSGGKTTPGSFKAV